MTDIDTAVTLSQAELKMRTHWAQDHHRPIMLWGASGIGKSALVNSFEEDPPEAVVEYMQNSGALWSNYKGTERRPGFYTLRSHALDHAALNGVMVDKGDHAGWLPLGEVLPHPDLGDPPCGIIFLDEINGAVQSIQLQLMQLVYDRRTANYKLPDGYIIVAAGNRAHDRAGIQLMTSPLKRRLVNIHIRADLDEWVTWALQTGIDPRVVGFLRLRPDLLITPPTRSEESEACPRTWEYASGVLTSPRQLPPELVMSALADCVGNGPAAELKGFLDVTDKMPDLDALIRGQKVERPTGSSAPSVCYAICAGLVQRLARPPKSLGMDRRQIAERIIRWTLETLSEEYTTMLVKDAVRVAEDDVAETEAFCDWSEATENFVL